MVKGNISISRVNREGGDTVCIQLQDNSSRITFVDLELSLEDMMKALLGSSCLPCDITVRGLANVGKVIEKCEIEFEVGKLNYETRQKEAFEIAKSVTPEGWDVSSYFNSQNSFFTKDGKEYSRTAIYRWVDPEDPNC